MISWIQRTFQQHMKWLFGLLLVVVIISFVFITNASSGLGDSRARKLADRPFFGLNLALAEDARRLLDDAQLSLFIQRSPARPEPSSAELEQYALQRHLTLHLADKLGLATPTPDSPAVVAHIQGLGRFTSPDGRFDPKAYAAFIDSLETNPRLSQADIARVILDDVRVAEYQKLLAGPGYVLPGDLSEQAARRDTRWTLALATLSSANFNPESASTDEVLAPWFETNARRYEISPRVVVSAVRFPAALYAGTVALSEDEVRKAYDANPALYDEPLAEGAEKPAADAAFAAAREKVEATLRDRKAREAALAAADDLAVALLENRIAPAGLTAFLAPRNLVAEDLGEIGQGAIPASLAAAQGADVVQEALRLSADRPYSNSIPLVDGAALLIWRSSVAARTPALAEVRSAVVTDYLAAEKRRRFEEASRQVRTATVAALAAGKSFAEAVAEAVANAGLTVEVKTPEPFTLMQPPTDMDFTAYQALASLNKGGVSDSLPTREGALLVHAIDKEVPAFDATAPEVAEIRSQMASALADRNAQGLLAELIQNELSRSTVVPAE